MSTEAVQVLESQPAAAITKQDSNVSQKLQVLVQQEKQAREARAQADLRLSAAEQREKALADREKKMQEFEALGKTNPMEALKLLGLDYKQLTDISLNDGTITADVQLKQLRDELDGFKRSQVEERRLQAEQARKAAEQNNTKVISDFKEEIKTFCTEKSSEYELINFDGQSALDLVFDVIDENYNRTLDPETGKGQIWDFKTAADKVEKHLQTKKYTPEKLKSMKYFQQIGAPQRQVLKPNQTGTQAVSPTLTNTSTFATQRPRHLSEEQRIAQIVANFAASRGA